MVPRLLTTSDIVSAMRLKTAANWNQTEQDWGNLLRLSPEGVFGIECDGQLVATASAVCFGDRLAWIGMVLTDPAYRGRGLARRLMEHTIEWIEARGVDWIKLDATDMGHALYARLGFEDESVIERWARTAAPYEAPTWAESVAPDFALDAAAFGADRSELLGVLAEGGCSGIAGKAFAMGRPGSKACYFGPCVARSANAARPLLASAVARHAHETIYWDILPTNPAAIDLAREFGFAPLRHLIRMVRPGRPSPTAFPHHDSYIFAIAGFEYG